ncbi:MAG: phage/plasmid primase, P4 family [Candidatus Scalinduaceae bacterium]
MTNIEEWIEKYREKGFSIIPLIPNGKIPAIKSWRQYQDRFATDKEIVKWFGNGSKFNVGVVTGKLSGIDVLDLDSEQAVQYAQEHNIIRETPSVKTGKGFHYWYKHKEGVRNFQKKDSLPDIDLRGEGGYIVAPPSIHPSGQQYQWLQGKGLDDIPCAELPEIVLAKNSQDKKQLREIYKGVQEGNRNDSLARLVGSWVNNGLTFDECLENARLWNAKNHPPLREKEIIQVIKSIRTIHENTNPERPIFNYTDLGNAQRFVAHFGGVIRFSHTLRKWLIWNQEQGFWEFDTNGKINRLAKKTIKKIYNESSRIDDEGTRTALAKWAIKSESIHYLNAMVKLAESEEGVPISPDELDTNLWILNCLNGTIDLKTGQLRKHNKNDYITKVIPVEYDIHADCPKWIEFLEKIMDGNDVLIAFLKRAIGYSLTGNTSEQCLFMMHGVGANGKSTLISTINTLLSCYGQISSFETFLLKRNNTITNDIAKLRGARFVSAIEAEGERRLAEVLVKQLTGGDMVSARFLFSEFFEFIPQFKLWLACNHKPTIHGTDHAIWRRIRLIPFTVQIPESEQDKELGEKLREELPGILTWAVQGCLEWQHNGLDIPEEVLNATSEYRQEMDDIGIFLSDCCELGPGFKETPAKLYEYYKIWCEKAGEYPLKQRAFGLRLSERNVESVSINSVRYRNNIKLKSSTLVWKKRVSARLKC